MSVFSNILDKLGFDRRGQQGARPSAGTKPGSASKTGAATGGTQRANTPSTTPASRSIAETTEPAPATHATPGGATPISETDVMGKLQSMAAANPQQLNWRTSIVDLLKLLGLDSSLSARKELATELGCPAEKMNDSAQMNTWLHKALLQRLAENGGNVPKELLH